MKVVTAAGEQFPEGAPVGVDLTLRDLYLFDPASRNTLCYGVD